jgi:hypothetical protein
VTALLRQCWTKHSLTIVSGAFTAACWTLGFSIRGRVDHQIYDFVMNLGHATFSIVWLYAAAVTLREVAKPED